MKLKYSFKSITVGNTVTAVPVAESIDAFHGVLNVNETGAFLLELLQEETTMETMVARVMREYAGEEAQIRNYAEKFVAGLRENGLLLEEN